MYVCMSVWMYASLEKRLMTRFMKPGMLAQRDYISTTLLNYFFIFRWLHRLTLLTSVNVSSSIAIRLILQVIFHFSITFCLTIVIFLTLLFSNMQFTKWILTHHIAYCTILYQFFFFSSLFKNINVGPCVERGSTITILKLASQQESSADSPTVVQCALGLARGSKALLASLLSTSFNISP